MQRADVDRLERWFHEYTGSFDAHDADVRASIALKVRHTLGVRENVAAIAKGEGFPASERADAEASALLHDVGRFPQIVQYGTFEDSKSMNHALMSVRVIEDSGLLSGIDAAARNAVVSAVKYHSAMSLPDLADSYALKLLKLVRDADKLDIWRVFIELYEGSGEGGFETATYGLPETPGYSSGIVANVLAGRGSSIWDAKSVNDIRLVHLSWIYRLNFQTTYRLVEERGYIKRMARWLPDDDDINQAISHLTSFARKKSGS